MSQLAERFAAVTAERFSAPLESGCTVRAVSEDEWGEAFETIGALALPEERLVSFSEVASADAVPPPEASDPLLHRLLIYEGDRAIGLYGGGRDFRGWYYMRYTAIHPEHQRRGIYSQLLERLLGVADALEFEIVYSRHRADNNAVLVPKLKRGFVISGFEISLKYGAMVELRRFLNPGLAELHAFRVDGARNAADLQRRKLIPR